MELIPAIDIIEGKCVRLTKGNYSTKKVYNENPAEVAKAFEASGLTRLHLVDLDGAKAKRIVNWKVLEKISLQTNLIIDFGGGLRTDEDLRVAFESGASQVTGGSIAVKNKQRFTNWVAKYGEKVILGADVMNERVAVSGWEENTGIELMPFLSGYLNKGIKYCICTDISKDGMLEGSSIELYHNILHQFPELKLIASGGVSSLNELDELQSAGLHGAIIGKAIYEGTISLKELSERC